MRPYAQYCALAKALDVVGDRWTLLVIRELLIRSDCRFTDIRNGLPGIASNLLTERLRHLEAAGLVTRKLAPPPIAATLYSLNPTGRRVAPIVEALSAFGAHLLHSPGKNDVFQSHWLCLPLAVELKDRAPKEPPVTVEVRTGNEPIVLQTHTGRVSVRPGAADNPDAIISGSPSVVMKFLLGHVDAARAKKRGLRIAGSERAVMRMRTDVHPPSPR